MPSTRLRSAPRSSNSFAAETWPSTHALYNGVKVFLVPPVHFRAVVQQRRAESTLPYLQAMCSGVQPKLFAWSTAAPSRNNIRAASSVPRSHAINSGVRFCLSSASISRAEFQERFRCRHVSGVARPVQCRRAVVVDIIDPDASSLHQQLRDVDVAALAREVHELLAVEPGAAVQQEPHRVDVAVPAGEDQRRLTAPLARSTAAPLFSNSVATSTWPFWQATISGVQPPSLYASDLQQQRPRRRGPATAAPSFADRPGPSRRRRGPTRRRAVPERVDLQFRSRR